MSMSLAQRLTSDLRHLLVVNDDLDEDGVVPDVVERIEDLQLDEFLRAEASVPFADWPPQERLVLLAGVRFHRVGHVAARFRVLALIDQGEGDPVSERPGQQSVILAFADANEKRHVFAASCGKREK